MLVRLPYRLQIPLGLTLAILITAALITVLLARVMVQTARQETRERIDRAALLISAQSKTLLAAEDVWRVFTLLRSTTALLPGSDAELTHAAVLDRDGYVFAASNPQGHAIGQKILGTRQYEIDLPEALSIETRRAFFEATSGMVLIEPVRSDDGQKLGFVYIEVDGDILSPAWWNLARFAIVGSVLTAFILIPIGWWIGVRMAKPIAEFVQVIGKVGKQSTKMLRDQVPKNVDPELTKIGHAIMQLLDETDARQMAQQRALSSQRLAAVGRIAAVIAHEVNNPLAGLITATQTLRLHGETESIRLQSIGLVERGLMQIRSTINALLPQARLERRALVIDDLTDMTTLVQPTAMRFATDLQVSHSIQHPLLVPAAPMRQVMLNLLLNAIKAAGENGQVQALLSADHFTVRFEVSNNGYRLSDKQLQQFLTTESGADPHGFGLWVCNEIAVQCNGVFRLDHSVEDRTKLVFQIPNQPNHE